MRAWLRRRLAAWAYPEIGRLNEQVADEQQRAAALTGQLAQARADADGTTELMLAWRDRALAAERERDAWRLRARCRPDSDEDEAARHAEVERTGGR